MNVTKIQEAASAATATVTAIEAERAALQSELATVQAEVETVLDEQAAVRAVSRERVIVNTLKAVNQKLTEAKTAQAAAQQAADHEAWRRLEGEFAARLQQFAQDCMNLREAAQNLYHLDDQRSLLRARATAGFHAGGDSNLLGLQTAVESWLWARQLLDVTSGEAGRVVTLKKEK